MITQFSLRGVLPFLGTLPFVFGALLPIFGVREIPFLGPIESGVAAYGLTIVSFMAGVHWGQYLSGVQSSLNLLMSSNAVALIAWGSYIGLPLFYVWFVFVGLFAALYAIDTQMAIEPQYLYTRKYVTAIVSACLVWIALV